MLRSLHGPATVDLGQQLQANGAKSFVRVSTLADVENFLAKL